MIESGLVALITADNAVRTIAPVGGFPSQLPNDQALPSWTYMFVSDIPGYSFQGESSLTARRLQIDCFATNGADVIRLADAIDKVLSAYKGTLTDADSTRVEGCFRTMRIDFFDTDAQNFRRLLEYMIWFHQS